MTDIRSVKISTVLSRFKVILFLLAQFMMWAISCSTDVLECWGDKRVASSAYFMRKFKISSGLRSWANIIKSVGPIPEPCMIDQFISSMEERWKPRLLYWLRSVRNDMIHWIIKTGVSRQNSLQSSITWSTVSRALSKSISTHLTYSLDSSKVCIWWARSASARVVEPVGL